MAKNIYRAKMMKVTLGLITMATINANAQFSSKTYDVKSGTAEVIETFIVYDDTSCAQAPLAKTRITQPKNGKITVSSRSVTISDGHCNGKSGKALAVVYQSNRGYRGSDSAAVDFIYPRYFGAAQVASHRSSYRLNVK